MELRNVNNVTKDAAKGYAVTVLEDKFSCKVKSIKYVGGGSFGYVYLAETDTMLKKVIMKACRTDGMCKRESQELTLLGKNSLIKIPEVYFTFLATDEIPIDFICMEYMEGKDCFTNFTFLLKSPKKKKEFADKITSAMHVWHETENNQFGLLGNAAHDSWLGYYKPFAEDILHTARELYKHGKLEIRVMDTMERAWNSFDEIFSEPINKAGLIHGDLNVMNIMADNDLNPTAIIDPLESKWADTEYDLFQLRNLTGECFGLYKMYKSKYSVSEKCDLKTSFYALFNEVYCYIISGNKINMILMPLVRRMNRELKKSGLYKQSLSSKIVSALLCTVFHSPLINNKEMSNKMGRKTRKLKSRYKPSKDFSFSRHMCENAFYERLIPVNTKSEKVIFMFHGGSFKVGLVDMYRRLAEKYSRTFGNAVVINVDYRLFPEHSHPAQLEDALAIYREILGQGIKPENIVVIGDSAGANLALTMPLWLRNHGEPMPSAIVTFSLWGDMTGTGTVCEINAYKDPFNGIAKRKKIADNLEYLHRISSYAENIDRMNEYVSPIFADFSGFPPTTLICAGGEVGAGDSITVYEKMKEVGVDVALYNYENLFHDFQLIPFLPESKDVYEKVKKRICN